MPSIRRSQAVDTSNLQPVERAPATPIFSRNTEVMSAPTRSPFMLSSMPLAAATSDLFARQFYGGTAVPQQRILPPMQRRTK